MPLTAGTIEAIDQTAFHVLRNMRIPLCTIQFPHGDAAVPETHLRVLAHCWATLLLRRRPAHPVSGWLDLTGVYATIVAGETVGMALFLIPDTDHTCTDQPWPPGCPPAGLTQGGFPGPPGSAAQFGDIQTASQPSKTSRDGCRFVRLATYDVLTDERRSAVGDVWHRDRPYRATLSPTL